MPTLPVLLLAQNRVLWDRVLIRRGLAALERAEQLVAAAPAPPEQTSTVSAAVATILHALDVREIADAWKPWIEACINAFGAERCMFESNFPVDKGMFSYQVLWNAFKLIAADYSADEKTALFSGAATRFYRLAL